MKTIIIWKTPTCTRCPQVMRLLDSEDVPYETRDLSSDENKDSLHHFKEILGIREVPIIEYGDRLFIGGFYGETMELIKQWKTDNAIHSARG